MKANASSSTLTAAREVLAHNKVINRGCNFEVYEVPERISTFRAYALLLFREAHDFGEGNVPKGTMIIPVTIDSRRGYLIDKEIARNYT
ncbi:MAG: hypothetical protein PHU88_02225 [candidate division Zixibacteria bacterium]|nr:hypothetical protein [candidate division Zixibacteria bacterium]